MDPIKDHDYYIAILAAHYKQELHMDAKREHLHPLIVEATKFLKTHIRENELEAFYQKIISNCEYFPKKINLSEIYNAFRTIVSVPKEAHGPRRGEIGTVEKLAIPTHEENSAVNENATIGDVIEADKTMTSRDMMRMYGSKKCGDAWYEIGKQMKDDAIKELRHKIRMEAQRMIREEQWHGRDNPSWIHD